MQDNTIALLSFGVNEIYETYFPKLVRFSSSSRIPRFFKVFTVEIIVVSLGESIILLKKSYTFSSLNVLHVIIALSNGTLSISGFGYKSNLLYSLRVIK